MTINISVVIPAYNRSELLFRTLSSVSRQTFQPLEVLVIDDGSSPPLLPTENISLPRIKYFRNEKNLGVAASRNIGIAQALGEWIALLDSDDEWHPCKLEKQVEYLRDSPEYKAVHTAEKWMRNNNEVSPPAYLDKSSHLLWERSLKHCLICPSSALLHRSLFQTIGLFDEALTACEDYDFWLRLLLQEEIGLVDEKLVVKHGGHEDQLSTTTWGMDRFRILALRKILSYPQLGKDRKISLLRVLHQKCTIFAQGSEKRRKFEEAQKYRILADQYCTRLDQLNPQPT